MLSTMRFKAFQVYHSKQTVETSTATESMGIMSFTRICNFGRAHIICQQQCYKNAIIIIYEALAY